ncbi:MAG: hypothetical protein ACRBFS_13100 [Aureispira sp.]
MESYQQRLLWAGGFTLLTLAFGGWMLPKQPASSMGSDWFWSNKAHPARQFEVLAVGDSRIYRGFSPTDFKATYAPDSALSVFNFGFSSAGLDTGFLKAATLLLDTTATTPIILLGITTSSLADENAVNRHFWQEQNRSSANVWQRKNINPYLTFFDPTSPNTLRNHWQGARQGYYQKHENNGWIASDKQPHTPWESYAHVQQTYPNVLFSLGFRQRLLQQIGTWQEQGIQVVAFRPPAAPHLEAIEMLPSYYPETAIKAEIEALGGIWVDFPNREQYQTYDGNHLVEASARQWSKDLGTLLRQAFQKKTQRRLIWQQQEGFETSTLATIIEEKTAPTGNKVQAVAAKSFSHTLTYELDALPFEHLELTAAIQARFPKDTLLTGAALVLSVENAEGMLLWEGHSLVEHMVAPLTWTKLQLSIPYHHQKAGALLKVYVWNNREELLLLDDLRLEISTR